MGESLLSSGSEKNDPSTDEVDRTPELPNRSTPRLRNNPSRPDNESPPPTSAPPSQAGQAGFPPGGVASVRSEVVRSRSAAKPPPKGLKQEPESAAEGGLVTTEGPRLPHAQVLKKLLASLELPRLSSPPQGEPGQQGGGKGMGPKYLHFSWQSSQLQPLTLLADCM
jgi:hypothetical protein